jgi:hypothetical protein
VGVNLCGGVVAARVSLLCHRVVEGTSEGGEGGGAGGFVGDGFEGGEQREEVVLEEEA